MKRDDVKYLNMYCTIIYILNKTMINKLKKHVYTMGRNEFLSNI